MAARQATLRASLSLAALLLAAGCGMYGDLYLEEPEAPARPEVEERPPIVTEPAPAVQPGATEEQEKEQAEKPKQPPPDGLQATRRS